MHLERPSPPCRPYPRTRMRAGTASVVAPEVALAARMVALAPGSPDWVHISPNGTLTLTPSPDTRVGRHQVHIQVTEQDGAPRLVSADIEVLPVAFLDADRHNIDAWCEVITSHDSPGGVALVTVDGGKSLPEGAHVESAHHGARIPAVPVNDDQMWVASPRLMPSLRVRVVYPDGSTDVADAALLVRERS